MVGRRLVVLAVVVMGVSVGTADAGLPADPRPQGPVAQAGSPAAHPAGAVPRVMPVSGAVRGREGQPVSGPARLTFAIYAEAEGGVPLWVEQQAVTLEAQGRFAVWLGAAGEGMPVSLFQTGEARWLGVRAEGLPEQPRVPLLSVPYALKASDAETLGGLPVSAFLRAVAPERAVARPPTDAPTGMRPAAGVTAADPPGTATDGLEPSGSPYITAFGYQALFSYDTGDGYANSAFGYEALKANDTGSLNTATGYLALLSNTSGNANTATGALALTANATGSFNTAAGTYALENNTEGSGNTAAGYEALRYNTAGDDNTACGRGALYGNTTGSFNTAAGSGALWHNIASFNTAAGSYALYENSTGSQNTAAGFEALRLNVSGSGNVAVGYRAGYHASGSNNVYIANEGVGADSGAIYLGTIGTHTKTVLAGDVGVGKASPSARLHVAGDAKFEGNLDTANGANRALTLRSATNYNYTLRTTGDDFQILEAGGIPRVHIDYPGGRVGINTTSPTYGLDVNGTLGVRGGVTVAGSIDTASGANRALTLRSATNYNYTLQTTGDDFQILEAGGIPRVHIAYPGGYIGLGTTTPTHPLEMASGAHVTAGGVWTNASSRALKDRVTALSPAAAIETLAALEPVTYVYKADPAELQVGFIAEDVPDLVATRDRKGLSPMDLVAVAVKVIQEQQQQLAALRTQVAAQSPGLAAQGAVSRALAERQAALEGLVAGIPTDTRPQGPVAPAGAVPRVMPVSGAVRGREGQPVSGPARLTFAIYAEAEGGVPLWVEQQAVTLEAQGRFAVWLGAAGEGMPVSLFQTGEARWLGVQAEGLPEQPRVPLLSVPYALKASDAETLGGLPVSAFLRADAAERAVARPTTDAPTGARPAAGVTAADPPGTATDGLEPSGSPYITAFGYQALFSYDTSDGYANSAFGYQALKTNDTGSLNTATGYLALLSNTSGNANTATGAYALTANTTGGRNTAAGTYALQYNTEGSGNTAAGYQALHYNTAGDDNTACGAGALYGNTTGSFNTAAGSSALYHNVASFNTAVGHSAASDNWPGSQNTAAGSFALRWNFSGLGNVAVGYWAGYDATGSNNVYIANPGVGGESGAIYLGTIGTHTKTVLAGDVGVGKASPSARLHVAGDAKIEGNLDTANGANRSLTLRSATNYNYTLQTTGDDFQILEAGGIPRVHIAYPGGRVGINTTSPTSQLDVNGTLGVRGGVTVAGSIDTANGANRALTLRSATNYNYSLQTTGDDFQILEAGGIPRVHIDYPGGYIGLGTTTPTHPLELASGAHVTAGGVWTNASSRALKDRVTALSPTAALETLAALEPVTYVYKADPAEPQVGFIAEDVPDLVATRDRKGLSPMDIVAVAVKVIQEQQQQLTALRTQVAAQIPGLAAQGTASLALAERQAALAGLLAGLPADTRRQGPVAPAGSPAAQPAGAVPRVMPVSGAVRGREGQPVSGPALLTFAIYAEAEGGVPLWVEQQAVTLDAQGRFAVWLGAAGEGMPVSLFQTGEARWLGVQAEGLPEQPRVPLLSVPYALKASDAETLGGLPVSAFLRADAPERAVARPTTEATTDAHPAAGVTTADPPGTATDGVEPSGSPYVTAYGYLALHGYNVSSGYANSAFGYEALRAMGKGYLNTATGHRALAVDNSGNENTATGAYAMAAAEGGWVWGGSTAAGTYALQYNTEGNGNTAAGYEALRNNTGGGGGMAFGHEALRSNSGLYNTAAGSSALRNNTAGHHNTAYGIQALYGNSTGSQNTGAGSFALRLNSSGSGNVAVGYRAGYHATGSNNVYIANEGVGGESGAIYLGTIATQTKTVLAGDVGVGKASPSARLHVAGDAKFEGSLDTTNGANRALTLRSATNYNYTLQTTGDDFQILEAGGIPRVHIAYPGGRVGINTTTPTSQLDVNGTLRVRGGVTVAGSIDTANGANRALTLRSATNYAYTLQTTGDDFQILDAGGIPRVHIDYPGGYIGLGTTTPTHPLELASGAHVTAGGVWTNASSRALKDRVTALSPTAALETLAALEPVTYVYKADPAEVQVGFIAEDVPDLVATRDRKGLSPMDLVAVAVKVIQEQQQQLTALRAQVAAQSADLAAQGAASLALAERLAALEGLLAGRQR